MITLFTNNPMIVSSSYEDVLIDDDISGEAYFAQDGESVVYTKKLSECEYAVVKYDFSTKEKTILSGPYAYAYFGSSNPVFENYIAWKDFRDNCPILGDMSDVYLTEFDTGVERKITSYHHEIVYPIVTSHYIGWVSYAKDTLGIFFKDLNKNELPKLAYSFTCKDFMTMSFDGTIIDGKAFFVFNHYDNGYTIRTLELENKNIKVIASGEDIDAKVYTINNHVFFYDPKKLYDYDIRTEKIKEVYNLNKDLRVNPLGQSSTGNFYFVKSKRNGTALSIMEYNPSTGFIKDIRIFSNNEHSLFNNGCLYDNKIVYLMRINNTNSSVRTSDLYTFDTNSKSEEKITNTYETEYMSKIAGYRIIYLLLHTGAADNGEIYQIRELRCVFIK